MKEMTQQSKLIFDLLQSDKGLINPIQTPVNNLNTSIQTAKGHMDYLNSFPDPVPPAVATGTRKQLDDAGLTISFCTAYKNKLSEIETYNLQTLVPYCKGTTEEFSRRIQVARSYIDIMTSATRPYTDNPYQNVMNVSTGQGYTKVETIKSSVDITNAKLQALKTGIQNSASNVPALATTAKTGIDQTTTELNGYKTYHNNLISSEESTYLKYIKTSTDGYLAVSLPKWNADSQTSGIVKKVSSDQLKALLN